MTRQNWMHEEIKSSLMSGNVCYHSVQNFFFLPACYKKLKINTYSTIIFPVVLYGCETWSPM